MDRAAVEQAIVARGLRLTPQRRAVIDALCRVHAGVSPLQVYDAARVERPEIGLTTVYRTLAVLEDAGALRRVHGKACEAVVPAGAAHGHCVVCDGCGAIEEFTGCDIAPVAAAAAAETGFLITGHFLQLSGRCASCREGSTAEARP